MFRQFSNDELAFVAALKSDQLEVGAHQNIVDAGTQGHRLYTLLDGWAFRYETLPRGRRQVLDFLLPGSLISLQSPLTGRNAHSVCSITRASLCVLDGEAFTSIFVSYPALAEALMQMLVGDQERADRRLLLLGRQRPTERLAYLLLELRSRLGRRGMMAGDRCEFPLTYELLADAAGMSRSQLASSLAHLRELGWATMQQGLLRFENAEKMARACGYVEPPPDTTRFIL